MKNIILILLILNVSSISLADVLDGVKNYIKSVADSSKKNDVKGKCENLSEQYGPHEILRKVGDNQYLAAVYECKAKHDCSWTDSLVVETTSRSFTGPSTIDSDLWVEPTGKKINVKDSNGFETSYTLYKENTGCAVIDNTENKTAKVAAQKLTESFIEALSSKNLNKAKEIMRNGLDANGSQDSASVLYASCRWGDLDIVKYLVDKGAKVNQPDEMNITPLIIASFNNKKDILEYLITKGADINHVGAGKRSALSVAKEAGNKQIVNILIKAGAKK